MAGREGPADLETAPAYKAVWGVVEDLVAQAAQARMGHLEAREGQAVREGLLGVLLGPQVELVGPAERADPPVAS